MEILLFILLATLLFPGSKGGSVSEYALIPVFLVLCAGLVATVATACIWVGKSLAIATGEDWIGIAAGFATLGVILTANFFVAEWTNPWWTRQRGTP